MDLLQQILDQTELPLLTALILGLMTAISPCPLATNITAMGYIAKDIQEKRQVFINGLIYILGRAFSYTVLGMILYFSATEIGLSYFFQIWGNRIIGPLILLIGILMLNIIPIRFPAFGRMTERFSKGNFNNKWRVFLMGIVFALAFCPYSGVLYFGMLMPLAIASPEGLSLPVIYAIGTGLPVIVFAWILAYAINSVGKAYKRIKIFEIWFRRIIAIMFVCIGLYYTINIFI